MGVYFGMGPRALLENDVILVEIQYRLGPLGYMCLDHPEAAGNMGMLLVAFFSHFDFSRKAINFKPFFAINMIKR